MIDKIKLFKKTPFDDITIYTAYGSYTVVTSDIIQLLSFFLNDTDIICQSSEILVDVLKRIRGEKEIISSNADFTHPIPYDMIKDKMLIVKGLYTTGNESFYKIIQLAFIYNNHKIRMGVINNE